MCFGVHMATSRNAHRPAVCIPLHLFRFYLPPKFSGRGTGTGVLIVLRGEAVSLGLSVT
jgi:hypothetical protein